MVFLFDISGSILTPRSGKAHLVLGTLWFAVIVILALFTGTLTSHLAVSVTRLPYSKIDQVVQASDYRIRVDTESIFADLFKVWGGSPRG